VVRGGLISPMIFLLKVASTLDVSGSNYQNDAVSEVDALFKTTKGKASQASPPKEGNMTNENCEMIYGKSSLFSTAFQG
jgi:hypothetical protein